MDEKPYPLAPVEPEELMFALALGDAAATLKAPVENPSLQGINFVDEKTAQVMRLSLTDRPINRAALAVRDHFKGDKFVSIMMRLFALFDVVEHKLVQRWVRKSQDRRGHEIAESLVHAAAIAPLTTRRKFKVSDLVRLAKEYDDAHDFED